MDPIGQLKKDIISACRILSQKKLVEGFGHVSARISDTEHFLITPRMSLALVEESDLLTINLKHEVEAARQRNHPHSRPRGEHILRDRPQARTGAQSRQLFRWRRAGALYPGS